MKQREKAIAKCERTHDANKERLRADEERVKKESEALKGHTIELAAREEVS